MDYIAHGLWGVGFFRKYKGWKLAFFFGVLADTISFVPLFLIQMFRFVFLDGCLGSPNVCNFLGSDFLKISYGLGHSFFVSVFVILVLWKFSRKFPIYALGWPFAILLDLFVHSRVPLGTPFLWPFFDYKFDGIPWSTPWIMITNYVALFLVFFVPWIWKKYKRK